MGNSTSSSSDYPPFSLEAPSRHDLSTYLGRVRHFQDVTDARTLFTPTLELQKARNLIEGYKNKTLPADTPAAELWKARQLISSTLHPDTNQPIFPLFRFSSFALANIPIVAALLYPTSNVWFIGGAQILNQSYNVAVNYANRNASSEMPLSRLFGAYFAAVGTSCSIAIGLDKLTKKTPTIANSAVLRSFVPITAVAAAGIVNLVCIRQTELTDGIAVFDSEGTERGKSVTAGRDAIFKCSMARILWTIPSMLIPPAVMSVLDRINTVKTNPRVRFFTELSVIGATIWFIIPFAIAAYPQRDALPASALEPQFQNLKTAKGENVTTLWFNKGI